MLRVWYETIYSLSKGMRCGLSWRRYAFFYYLYSPLEGICLPAWTGGALFDLKKGANLSGCFPALIFASAEVSALFEICGALKKGTG